MNLFNAIEISGAGLSAERTRINVGSMNLANAHVTRTLDGGPYRAKSVIFSSKAYRPDPDVGEDGQLDPFQDELNQALQTVEVNAIVDDPTPFQEVYDPKHPDADERGIVRLPNVNVMEQMVDIMTASRAYEANVTAIETAKSMALKTLDIAR